MPSCVVLVINDNLYGLMFALRYLYRSCPWELEDYMMTKVLSKALYEEWSPRVELIASMAWKRSLSEHSCLSPSHHIHQEKNMKCKWIHEDGA